MRPVVFVKYYDKASTVLGADLMSEALAAAGRESASVHAERLGEFRDAILVFIKTSKIGDLLAARRRGNRLVLDLHDTLVFKRRIKNAWLFDGVMFRNRRQFEDYRHPDRRDVLIYQQWDPRYRPHRASGDGLRVCYLGDPRSLELWGRLPGVDLIVDDFFRRALDYDCHLSVRQPGREFRYKPSTKVNTAAACKAVVVTTRDASAEELLGPDYPFYVGHTRAAVEAGLARARAARGGPDWRRALAILAEVRERTSTERIVGEYLAYFETLG